MEVHTILFNQTVSKYMDTTVFFCFEIHSLCLTNNEYPFLIGFVVESSSKDKRLGVFDYVTVGLRMDVYVTRT